MSDFYDSRDEEIFNFVRDYVDYVVIGFGINSIDSLLTISLDRTLCSLDVCSDLVLSHGSFR